MTESCLLNLAAPVCEATHTAGYYSVQCPPALCGHICVLMQIYNIVVVTYIFSVVRQLNEYEIVVNQ